MHPDHAVRALRGRGQRGDRDRRGVGGEDRLRRQRLVRAAEDVLLHRCVLDHGLDHQVGRDQIVFRDDACEDLLRIRPALLGELAEALSNGLEGAAYGAGRGVVQRHPPPGSGHDLRDPAPHLAGADHEDVLKAHAPRLTKLVTVCYLVSHTTP